MKRRFVSVALAVMLMLGCFSVAQAGGEIAPPELDQALEELGYQRDHIEMLSREEKQALVKSGKLSERELDEYLDEAGYPEELVVILDYAQKVDIYLNQATYSSHHVEYQHLTDGKDEEYGIRSWNNFTHWFSVHKLSSSSGQHRYMIYYNWRWNYAPNITLTDKFGMSWSNHQGWWIENNSWRMNYTAVGQNNTHFYYWNNFSDMIATGVGWSFNIRSSINGDPIVGHRGWGRITIRVNHGGTGGSSRTELAGNYFHKLFGSDSPLVFEGSGQWPSVNIQASWRYDRPSMLMDRWTWFHSD